MRRERPEFAAPRQVFDAAKKAHSLACQEAPCSGNFAPMKFTRFFAMAAALVAVTTLALADENHEIIEKVMKEGLKGDDSPYAKAIDGELKGDDAKDLAALFATMKGTKAPKGDQDAYEEKVDELIAAMNAVAGGDTSEKALGRLDEAGNCKACHTPHKPKKK